MENSLSNGKKGFFSGIFSGMTWGLDTTLMGVVLLAAIFNKDEKIIFLAPLLTAFLHDLFSVIWMIIYHGVRGNLKNSIKKVFSKNGGVVAIAALLGGPVGMTGYLLAVKYIGPAYTASISAFYPAVGALFAFIILKDKLSIKGVMGLALSIGAILVLGYSSDGMSSASMIGFAFALLAVIGWGLECVVCAYGMKGDDLAPDEALFVRQLTSALVYGVIIIPAMGGISVLKSGIPLSTTALIVATALAGTTSYLLYYTAINKIGATRAMALNITYSVWAIIFQVIFIGTGTTLKSVICSVLIICGSVIVAKDQENENIEFAN
ncbi:DMT family transporter [Clostridium paridis]|uniref:DMT family transporter n=1 Tax=Clostridium paridis TaxID=2803863 RepID=A0A937FIB0_9CLOT|nr:DMT family transporter [Clostridium paridis]MBL4932617.1 DMT family transporter [Clostridium paridis]